MRIHVLTAPSLGVVAPSPKGAAGERDVVCTEDELKPSPKMGREGAAAPRRHVVGPPPDEPSQMQINPDLGL